VNQWSEQEHALAYLARVDRIPFRVEGIRELVAHLPARVDRVLDLGTGDGRLLAAVREARPGAGGVAVDFSAEMLDRARDRYAAAPDVEVVDHDLDHPLPDWGTFDVVISGFAIHHLEDDRKAALYGEVYDRVRPDGRFLNLEHVASASDRLHLEFLAILDTPPERDDPSNKLALVETQLGWLRAVGFVDVDCHWKWRELALLAGTRP
jgi:SAM-dependent methyltransferase